MTRLHVGYFIVGHTLEVIYREHKRLMGKLWQQLIVDILYDVEVVIFHEGRPKRFTFVRRLDLRVE